MSILFWALTTTMVVAAVATLVIPVIVKDEATNFRMIAMAVVVSLFAIGLYSFIGTPDAVTAEYSHANSSRASVNETSNGKTSTSVASVASMVQGLRERLEKEPDDADGWVLLARSYEHLGQHQEALAAHERAKALGKTDPTLEQSLASTGQTTNEFVESAGPAIRGRISLSQEAALLVQPEDTVFIFAKGDAMQQMPLLALRKTIADLPLEYALTDAMAMIPGNSLADFDEVVVIARVSRSGRAKDVHLGLEVSSGPVSPEGWGHVDLQLSPEAVLNSDAGWTSE